MVAALITAAGVSATGAGGIVSAVFSRRSAREASAQAQQAGRDAAAANAGKLSYETLVFSVTTLQREYTRLSDELVSERSERRREAVEFNTRLDACHAEREKMAATIAGLTNGA